MGYNYVLGNKSDNNEINPFKIPKDFFEEYP